MENQRDSKWPKLKSLNGVVSPINMQLLAYNRRRSSLFDPYASDSSDTPSPLIKYLRSADSTPSFITPVKVEEDVIVMDGIPAPKSSRGGGDVRMRLSLTSSNIVSASFISGRSSSTPSPSSGSGGRDNIRLQKMRMCHFWETSGTCQFGSNCQFAHGKEELQRPPRSAIKIKLEILKSYCKPEGSTSSYGTNYSPISQIKSPEEEEEEVISSPSPSPSVPAEMAFSSPPVQTKHVPRSDWTPQDDGIEVILPSDSEKKNNPSKEDVDAYIEKVLSGTNLKRRLPVFVEICPE